MAHRFRFALLVSVSAAGLATPVLAATSTIETVIVTAEKRSEQVKNVPMAVTVLGQDTFTRLNARNFEDYVAQVPGLSLTELSQTHPTLILRGINAGGIGSTVGVLLDETPYGSSSALANASILTANLDTYDLSRVEVLKGPQGTLYGASTLGGLLKFVTNPPDPTGWDDSFEGSYMGYGHGGQGGSFRAMGNVPIDDDLAVRASGFLRSTPGFIDDPGRGVTDINGISAYGGRVSVLYKPTDDIQVRLNALDEGLSTNSDATEDVVLLTGGKIVPKYGDYQQKRTSDTPQKVRYAVYNATVDWNLDLGTLTSATSYGQLHDEIFQDTTGALGLDIDGRVRNGKFTQEVRLASNAPVSGFDWLVGFFYTNEQAVLHQDLVLAPHGASLAFVELDSNYNEVAAFGNLTYHFTEDFDVSAGGRYSHDSQHANQFGLGTPANGASSDDVFTWSAAAHYALDSDTSLYARVAKGWRPGGPNVLPIGVPLVNVPRTFNPDSLINYEAGVKGTALDGRVSYAVDAFWIDWSNIQLLAFVGGTGVNINGGDARSAGVEGNVTWQPVDPLTFNFNVAYVDAIITKTDPKTLLLIDALKGDPLPWTPKWSSSIDADYRFDPMNGFTPYVGGTFRYVGERPSDFIGLAFQTGAVTQRQYFMPYYTTLDARIGLEWGNWAAEVYGRNLFEAKGFTAFAPTGNSVASGGAANVAVIAPREIGIVLRGKL
jgi:outer membrane receptor protein involved in Fe transport